MSKIREKESLECGRMHIWALKTQKLPGTLSGPWTLAANCSLRSRYSTSVRWQLSASGPGAPPVTKSWIRTCHFPRFSSLSGNPVLCEPLILHVHLCERPLWWHHAKTPPPLSVQLELLTAHAGLLEALLYTERLPFRLQLSLSISWPPGRFECNFIEMFWKQMSWEQVSSGKYVGDWSLLAPVELRWKE